jgi:hypothetical protein
MSHNAKWTKNSGFARNRNVGTARLKGDGGQIKPIETINGKIYNGYALNVVGSNLVFGLGTSTPFSRLSFGNNNNSGIYNINDTGQMASIALNETSSGGNFSGFFYNSEIKKYYQSTPTDISTNGIQFMTTDINNFNKYDKSGGLLFITNENVTTIGGQPRSGINEGNAIPLWKGIDIGEDPDISIGGSISGVSKVVLDIRGSIRTDGYINFFNKYYENNTVKYAPSAEFWGDAEDNIPVGSLWLQPTAGTRNEGLWFKNSSGEIRRVEATDGDANNALIDRNIALSLDMFNFLFRQEDYLNSTTQPAGEFSKGNEVNFPFVILKGKGSGQGQNGFVGGTALNIRAGHPQTLQNIIHQKGYNSTGTNQREIFSVTKGNISVTGLSGEEFIIRPHNSLNVSDSTNTILKHPMKNFYSHHALLQSDISGGKIWCERQLLIGPKKADINWAIIDVQTTPNSPTLLSYNLNKNWNYNSITNKINRRFITHRATNSIILLNKDQNNSGTLGGDSVIGELYDCSNSVIIGDNFKNLDIPKSLVINVNTSLNTENGQEIYDNIGGSIVSGYKNMIYSSPYSLVIGKDNFIHNNTISENGIGNNLISGEGNEVWSGKFNSINGEINKVSGNYNSVFGRGNIIGYFDSNLTKSSKRGTSAQANDFYQKHNYNTVLGGFNKLGIQNTSTGINYRNWYSFMAGSYNRIDTLTNAYNSDGAYESVVALGTGAYVGGDLRFAFGMGVSSNPTSSNNQNVFVIDCSKNFGFGFGEPIAALNSTIISHDSLPNGYSPDLFGDLISNDFSANLDLIKKNKSVSIWLSKSTPHTSNYKGIAMGTTWDNQSYLQSMHLVSGTYMPYAINPKGGSVAINTLIPQKTLHIKTSNESGFGIDSYGNNGVGIFFSGSHSHMGNLTRPHIFNDYPDAGSGDNLHLECKGDFIWNNNSTVNHDEGQQTESMRLTSDGHLGIGTNNPTAKLQIDYSRNVLGGEVELLLIKNTGTTMPDHSVRIWNTGDSLNNTYISIEDAFDNMVKDTVRIGTGDSFFDGDGAGSKVGIGTRTPEEKLHLEGGNFMMSRAQQIQRVSTDVVSTRTHYRSFEHSITRLADRNFRETSGYSASLGETHKIIFGYVDNYVTYTSTDLTLHPTNNAIKFHMINGSGSTASIPDEPTHAPQMIITGDYKVGINIINPTKELDVNGEALVRTDLTVEGNTFLNNLAAIGTTILDGNVGIGTASNTNHELYIKKTVPNGVNPTNHVNDMLHLQATYNDQTSDFGNVTRTPREGGVSILFSLHNLNQNHPGEAARIVAGCDELSNNNEYNSYLAFHTSNNGPFTGTVERMCIDYRGFVGINTPTPTKELEVNGEALVRTDLTVEGNTFLNNLAVTGTTVLDGTLDVTSNMFIGSGIHSATPSRLNIKAPPFVEQTQRMLTFDISGNPWMFRSYRKYPNDDYSTDLRLTCGGQGNWFAIDFDEGFNNIDIASNNNQDNLPIFAVKLTKDISGQIVYVKSKLSIGSTALTNVNNCFEARGDGRFFGNLKIGAGTLDDSYLGIQKRSFTDRPWTKNYFLGTMNSTVGGTSGTKWSGFYIQDSTAKFLFTIDDKTGNIGINNDIDEEYVWEKLDISGNLLIRTKGAPGGIYFKKDNVSAMPGGDYSQRYSSNAEYAGIEVNNNSRMRIEAHGGIEFYTGGENVAALQGVNGYDYHVDLTPNGEMNFWKVANFFDGVDVFGVVDVFGGVSVTGTVETNGAGKIKSDRFEGTFKDNDVKGPFMPIGTIIMWPGGSQPDQGKRGIWLPCNGGQYSRTSYPTLAGVLGYSSNTYFNTPDMQDRYPRSNTMSGSMNTSTSLTTYSNTNSKGGSEEIGVNNLPSHNHNFTGTAHTHTASSGNAGVHTHEIDSGTTSANAGHYHQTNSTIQGVAQHEHTIKRVYYGGSELPGVIRGYSETVSDYNAMEDKTVFHSSNMGHNARNTTSNNANHSHEIKVDTQQAGSHNHNVTVNNGTAGGTISNTGQGVDFKPKYSEINFLIYAGFVTGQ